MQKTEIEIQTDVYKLLQNSSLKSAVNGKVYQNGLRPRDSKAEDMVVIFTTGLSGQVQTGVITIHVFVPQISNVSNGVLQPNLIRVNTLEKEAQAFVDSLTASMSDYKFMQWKTIASIQDDELKQTIIVIQLKFKLLTN